MMVKHNLRFFFIYCNEWSKGLPGETEAGKPSGTERCNCSMGKKEKKENRFSVARRLAAIALLAVCCGLLTAKMTGQTERQNFAGDEWSGREDGGEAIEVSANGNYIKWVEYHVTCEAMAAAYELDVQTYKDEVHLNWVELLAYVGAKHGGKFDKNSVREVQKTAEQLTKKETTMSELTKDMEYYDYYLEAYHAVLDGMVGEFSLEAENDAGAKWKQYYGLKAFSPIAKGFDYSHYDDFGSSRSYGYARPHLGHDMMGMIGTPIEIKYRI